MDPGWISKSGPESRPTWARWPRSTAGLGSVIGAQFGKPRKKKTKKESKPGPNQFKTN